MNQFVYVYYTATMPAIHNRVSRFTANGDIVAAGSEVVLLDLENLSATNHNGGALAFGPDDKLYVAVGENAVESNAQPFGNRLGKILRVNRDGSIPADNPFFTTATARLLWSHASIAKAVVPAGRLYPAAASATPIRVNFQPAFAPVPAGYLPDGGLAYGARGNGQTYGWNTDNSAPRGTGTRRFRLLRPMTP